MAHRRRNVPQTMINPLLEIEAKFTRLSEVNARITAAKDLYAERDTLLKELMPYFIESDAEKFTLKKQIVIGNRTHRFTPSFFHDGEFKVKRWKSAAHETFSIE
jgi:hypothetical protein